MSSEDMVMNSEPVNLPAVPDSAHDAGEDSPEKVMTVVEHLDELRVRIMRSVAAVGLSFFVMLFFAKNLVHLLELPAGNITFQALSLEEPLLVYLKVTFYAGLVLALPYVLFEASQFVAPGLKPKERQLLAPIVIGGPLLFLAGAAFAYFCVLPPMLNFFNSFGQGLIPIHQRLDFYISLVSTILLYMGMCFQLPVVIFALSFTGLVNSRQLIAVWKYAIVGASLVAAIITPDPTAFSMLIVMGALIALYFLSIFFLKIAGR
jgi:sec-independent protein translocase protein TatC